MGSSMRGQAFLYWEREKILAQGKKGKSSEESTCTIKL